MTNVLNGGNTDHARNLNEFLQMNAVVERDLPLGVHKVIFKELTVEGFVNKATNQFHTYFKVCVTEKSGRPACIKLFFKDDAFIARQILSGLLEQLKLPWDAVLADANTKTNTKVTIWAKPSNDGLHINYFFTPPTETTTTPDVPVTPVDGTDF